MTGLRMGELLALRWRVVDFATQTLRVTASYTAGLRPLRFHDLRHTFGSVAIRTADPRELQEWMGHSDFSTTQIYMHYRLTADAARRLSAAFGDGGEPDTRLTSRPTRAFVSE